MRKRFDICTFPIDAVRASILARMIMYIPGTRAHVCNFEILDA